MVKRFALGLGLAMLVGGATMAGAQTSSATATTPSVKPEKPKRTCRKETPVGSIMPVSTCHTKDEWAAIDRANGSMAEQMRDPRGNQGGLGVRQN